MSLVHSTVVQSEICEYGPFHSGAGRKLRVWSISQWSWMLFVNMVHSTVVQGVIYEYGPFHCGPGCNLWRGSIPQGFRGVIYDKNFSVFIMSYYIKCPLFVRISESECQCVFVCVCLCVFVFLWVRITGCNTVFIFIIKKLSGINMFLGFSSCKI